MLPMRSINLANNCYLISEIPSSKVIGISDTLLFAQSRHTESRIHQIQYISLNLYNTRNLVPTHASMCVSVRGETDKKRSKEEIEEERGIGIEQQASCFTVQFSSHVIPSTREGREGSEDEEEREEREEDKEIDMREQAVLFSFPHPPSLLPAMSHQRMLPSPPHPGSKCSLCLPVDAVLVTGSQPPLLSSLSFPVLPKNG